MWILYLSRLFQGVKLQMLMSDPLAGYVPGKIVEITQSGYLRDQAFAQVQFFPVQYDAARGEVRFYRHIVAEIKQANTTDITSDLSRGYSPIYEEILRTTLKNYAALDRSQTSDLSLEYGNTNSASQAANGQQLKIGISSDGFYQLTYAELSAAGFDFAGVDAHSIKITNRGTELAIRVEGEEDGQFGPGDWILFYGKANADIYTTINIYWLSAGGDPGLRIATRSGTPGGAQLATQFPTTMHAEQDTYYWQTMPNGAGQDHWFWGDRISSNSYPSLPTYREYGLSLGHPSSLASEATIRVRLKGFTNDQYASPDHRTRLYLNNQMIEPGQYWDGFAVFDLQKTVASSLLKDGENIIKVEALPVTATVDQEFINWIEIDYWDTYIAQDNELVFSAPSAGEYHYQVDGFSSENIHVFDITAPYATVLITDTTVSSGTGYKLEFQDTAHCGNPVPGIDRC